MSGARGERAAQRQRLIRRPSSIGLDHARLIGLGVVFLQLRQRRESTYPDYIRCASDIKRDSKIYFFRQGT
jgi:hypothetical protein